MTKSEDVRVVAPALEKYAHEVVLGDLWKRAGLSPRDRSIVTVSALIARDQTVELPYYLNLALDNGVKPAEISEIITHLAFYTGWANAMDAIPAARDVFMSRNIGVDRLPPASGPQLPLDEAAEKQRATRVGEQFGQITPSLVQYTTAVLFRDLWLEPGARTACHTHPLGQTLIITAGLGWVQREGAQPRRSVPATSCGFRRD